LSSGQIQKWDERYRAGDLIHRAPARLVVKFASDLIPGSALDIACGPGRNTFFLAERGWRVIGLDGSPVAIDILNARAAKSQLAVGGFVVDLELDPFGLPVAYHDLVLCCYYLQRDLIPRLKSALRPGGMLIMIVNIANADQPEGTPTRAYPGELEAFFRGWRILHYSEGEPGGDRHGVAELVARKPADDDA
jgi:tellurite methyltransferase